ncbi:oligosaccharide flippase family protein [candidate division KSB1 bacterium]|nr:oligosaccharide flippase family protein [candidate division KSB1 bacterium]
MLNPIKRLTQHSLVYGIGHILSRFLGFLLLPIHTHFLQPDMYAIAALLFSSLAILNIFFSYGLDVAFMRYFVLADEKEEKQRLFSTSFWMILGTGLIFALILMISPSFFSKLIFRTAEYPKLIQMAAGILFADALVLMPFLVLRAEEKSTQFIVFKSLNIIINLGLNILLVGVLKKGLDGIFLSNLAASGITLVLMIPAIRPWLRLVFKTDRLKSLLAFGLPYIPSALSVIVMDQVSRFFLDRLLGKEATGIFSASYKLGMFMALVVAAFRFAWHPFFLSVSKQKDASQIYARVLTYFIFVLGTCYLSIAFFLREIVQISLFNVRLFGEGFEGGLAIVPIVMLAYVFYGLYVNFVVGIYLEKKSKLLPLITGAGCLTSLIANAVLIRTSGLVGAAWASVLAYAVMALSLYFVNRKLIQIPYEWGRVLKLIVVFILIYLTGSVWMHDPGVMIRVLLILLLLPLFWAVRFWNAQEKGWIRKTIIRK